MIETPQIVQTEARRTASIHLVVPREQIQQVMGPGIRELMDTLAAQGVKPTGPWFNRHRRVPSDTFDFEISVPVDRPVTAAGRVVPGELRAARVARTVHHGGYEGLGAAWGELEAWIRTNGLATGDDLWECYSVGPESSPDPAAWRTELNRPLAG